VHILYMLTGSGEKHYSISIIIQGVIKLPREVNGETYYTASEAARYLGIARETFNRNVKDKIQVYHLGALKREYYRQFDLNRFKGPRPVEEDERGQ
jgi:hypothetical protein